MKTQHFLTSLFAFAVFITATAQSPNQPKLDQFFNRLAEKNKAMGSIVLAKDNKPVYHRAIGYSQISATDKTVIGPKNKFRIGSITKMFTATIILQLVEEGKLKLTDKLNMFLPQVPNADKITIEQILLHRSGVPNVNREQTGQQNVKTLPVTNAEHLDMIVRAKPDFEPGTKAQYSNSGYILLGLIIGKLTGKSYADVLNERILSRIGLNDTYLATGNIDIKKAEALTYFILPGGDWKPVPETHPSLLFSAGAIVSTPYDLTKFIQALFDGKIISNTSLELMKTQRDGEGPGMVTFTLGGKTFYGHTGGADNYGAWLAYQPEERLALAYTTNAKVYPVKDIIGGVMDIYYDRPFEIPNFESIVVDTVLLDKYAGTYTWEGAPVKFTIAREGATLYAQPGSQKAVPLEATAQDTFKIDNGTAMGIIFVFDAANGQLKVRRDGGERIFIKDKQ